MTPAKEVAAIARKRALVFRWEALEGGAAQKAAKVLGRDVDYAAKLGRKTVFAHDGGGVVRLYIVGDDGWVYMDKVYRGLPDRQGCAEVLRAALTGIPILSDYRYRAPEVSHD